MGLFDLIFRKETKRDYQMEGNVLKLDRLKKAIETKELLKIIYHGGSQPGTSRDITANSLKDGRVYAFCLTSYSNKIFFVDKIEIIEDLETDTIEYEAGSSGQLPIQTYFTIDDLLKQKKTLLNDYGWEIRRETKKYVVAPSLEQEFDAIFLYSKFKNGKLRKTADMELSFTALTWDEVWGEDEEDISMANIKKRVKPWRVWAKKRPGAQTYGTLDRASVRFLELAEEHKPF